MALGARKARTMLREGTARGRRLTTKQRGLFGLIAGGGKPTRMGRARKIATTRRRGKRGR